jgi:hypothetical protein
MAPLLSGSGRLWQNRALSRGATASRARYTWRQVVGRPVPTGDRKADGGWWILPDTDGPMGW